ncbi:Na+/H+ antiporter NhaA, partial [Aliarcobacter butzleri]
MVKKYKVIDNFISKEALSGILLLFVTLFAIIVANSNFGDFYFNLWDKPLGVAIGDFIISMPLRLWINDGLMALFFLMVSLEIKRELLIGELA